MKIDAGLAVAIAGLLSLLSAIIVALINAKSQNNKIITEMQRQYGLVIYRLEQVEEKVTAHNNFDARMVALEERHQAFEEFVKTMFAQFESLIKTIQGEISK